MATFTIITKYLPATNTLGSRISAVLIDSDGIDDVTITKARICEGYNYALGVNENHLAQANNLAVFIMRDVRKGDTRLRSVIAIPDDTKTVYRETGNIYTYRIIEQ